MKYLKRFNDIEEVSQSITEVFELDVVDGMFTDEQPLSHWNQIQDDLLHLTIKPKREDNLLKIPYKNVIFKTEDKLNVFLFNKDDKPIVFAEFKKFNDGLQSKYIVKSKNANAPNLGLLIYNSVVDDLRIPIYSDIEQTNSSRINIWFKLFKKYPDRIVAYNMKTKKISKVTNIGNDFNPQVDNNPVYGSKKNIKINTHGEQDPNNQVVDWSPGGIDPFGPGFELAIDKFFQEKNLYLLKFLPK